MLAKAKANFHPALSFELNEIIKFIRKLKMKEYSND